MNRRSAQSLALIAMLGLGVLYASPQRTKGPIDEPASMPCHCEGGGASCLFGDGESCSITCYPPRRCICRDAWCMTFGGANAASCQCS